jgi:hypothetical protein
MVVPPLSDLFSSDIYLLPEYLLGSPLLSFLAIVFLAAKVFSIFSVPGLGLSPSLFSLHLAVVLVYK